MFGDSQKHRKKLQNGMNKITFNELSENISGIDVNGNRFGKSIDGISAWYHESDYDKFIGTDYESDELEIEVNGVKYHQHWFFVNESHDSNVCGVSLIDENNENDILFYVYGCRVDKVVSFDEMIDYLINEYYFV